MAVFTRSYDYDGFVQYANALEAGIRIAEREFLAIA